MFRKAVNIADKITDITQDMSLLVDKVETNPDIFTEVKVIQDKIADAKISISSIKGNIKKEMLPVLKGFSDALQNVLYISFSDYLEKYVFNLRASLAFKSKYIKLTNLHPDDLDKAFTMSNVLWWLISDIYRFSTPTVFVELCKNNNILSQEQTLSLYKTLIEKFIDTIIKNILDEVSDWDNDIKQQVIKETRMKFPHASNKLDYFLMSTNKWESIKVSFLNDLKHGWWIILHEQLTKVANIDFHVGIHTISMHGMKIVDEDALYNLFFKHVVATVVLEFKKSESMNQNKHQKQTSPIQSMSTAVLPDSQDISQPLKPLPEKLKHAIKGYLSSKKHTNGSAEKVYTGIEKTLQKFLTRNDAIRKQWFKDKITSYGSSCIDDDFFVLLETHGFTYIDDAVIIIEEKTDENTVVAPGKTPPKSPLSAEQNQMLADLDTYDAERLTGASKEQYLIKKMTGYVAILEKLGYKFENKVKFIESAAEYCHSNIKLDKDIKKLIADIIMKNKQEQHRSGRGYYVFTLPNGWRIMLWTKGIINDIGTHDYYEKYLKNNF